MIINTGMKSRSNSVGILTLQKQISTEIANGKAKKDEFVSFVNERRLGKLIKPEQRDEKETKRESIDQITFKNFKKIYNRERIIENARYSRMTRHSEQPDLISERTDWKVNRVSSLINFKKGQMNSTERECCMGWGKKPETRRPRYKFDKIDEDVYKKIAVSRPVDHIRNPEVNSLFRHYVEACEMNENIRRLELTTKKKY